MDPAYITAFYEQPSLEQAIAILQEEMTQVKQRTVQLAINKPMQQRRFTIGQVCVGTRYGAGNLLGYLVLQQSAEGNLITAAYRGMYPLPMVQKFGLGDSREIDLDVSRMYKHVRGDWQRYDRQDLRFLGFAPREPGGPTKISRSHKIAADAKALYGGTIKPSVFADED